MRVVGWVVSKKRDKCVSVINKGGNVASITSNETGIYKIKTTPKKKGNKRRIATAVVAALVLGLLWAVIECETAKEFVNFYIGV